jgi:hypothetical protein
LKDEYVSSSSYEHVSSSSYDTHELLERRIS